MQSLNLTYTTLQFVQDLLRNNNLKIANLPEEQQCQTQPSPAFNKALIRIQKCSLTAAFVQALI